MRGMPSEAVQSPLHRRNTDTELKNWADKTEMSRPLQGPEQETGMVGRREVQREEAEQ